jgi:TolB-like protein
MPNFLTEMKRRNVFRVAVAYTVVAWVIAQAFDLATDSFAAPDWVMKITLAILITGLPVAAILAWAFELTPEGVMKTEDVPVSDSITPRTGQKLNRLTVVALVLAVSFIAWDKLWQVEEAANVTATDKTVAVLPFADLSELQNQEWFADGLTEEILNALARLPELQVTARTSSFEFKNTNTDISEIASKLGVAHVVEGSVRRIGDDLRVTAQLIRARDGFHLWSETYDRNTEDLFDVQADIAENIATTLDVFLDAEKRNLVFASGTRSVPAFEAYMKGQAAFVEAHVRNPNSDVTLATANAYFDQALKLDPEFAQVAVMHADRYAHYFLERESLILGDTSDLNIDDAHAMLRRDYDIAIRSAPNPLSRIVAEINREFFEPHWHRLPVLIKQLREIDPSEYPTSTNTVWLHEILLMSGDLDLAQAMAESSRRVDPLNRGPWTDLAEIKVRRGNLDAAGAAIEEIRRTHGDIAYLMEVEVIIALHRGDKENALRLLQKDYEYAENMLYLKAIRSILEGDIETAEALIEEMQVSGSMMERFLIPVYYEMGDKERLRELVRRIDGYEFGSVLLGIDVAYSSALLFDLNDAPNFRTRLEEARIELDTLWIKP